MKELTKNIILSSFLVVAVKSFSFRPLKDLYYSPFESSDRIRRCVKLNSIQKVEDLSRYIYSLNFYDEPTFLVLNKSIHEVKSLFLIENTIEDKFTSFQYTKILSEDEMKQKCKDDELGGCFYNDTKKVPDYGYVPIADTRFCPSADALEIGKSATILSEVKIENTEKGVFLSKDGKSINLKKALKLYGKNSLEDAINGLAQALITDFIRGPKKEYVGKKKVEEKLNQRDNVSITRNELNYLKNSTILSVTYAISKMNLWSQKSILIGLARDNRTGKIFRWITDLGQDLSILMKYAVEPINTDKNNSPLNLEIEKLVSKKT